MIFDDKIGKHMGSGQHIVGPQQMLFLFPFLIDPNRIYAACRLLPGGLTACAWGLAETPGNSLGGVRLLPDIRGSLTVSDASCLLPSS